MRRIRRFERKIENCLDKLVKRELNEVIILNEAFDVTLVFGNDLEFHLFSFYTEEREQWKLFSPEKKVFIAGLGINGLIMIQTNHGQMSYLLTFKTLIQKNSLL